MKVRTDERDEGKGEGKDVDSSQWKNKKIEDWR